MKGYVARKGNRWYAVIYEGFDPVTGNDRRRWHAAGPCREDAERLAARLATELEGRNDEVRGITLNAFLMSRWLPGKRIVLAATTYSGYQRNVDNHIVPALGRMGLRRLRPHHLEACYDRLLHPNGDRTPLAPKMVYEIHIVVRGALEDAVQRGLLTRNVAFVAHAPRLRSIPKVGRSHGQPRSSSRCCGQLPVTGTSPRCGSPRSPACAANELLGLRWNDFDERRATISVNRGLVAIPCEGHETRGKTPRSRRRIDLDPTTVNVMTAWRKWQQAEQSTAAIDSAGWMFTAGRGEPIHPHAISHSSSASLVAPRCPSSACTTCATPTARCSSPRVSPSRW